jgi:scyllo-inositol 2-dehydrogenase (NADP+)
MKGALGDLVVVGGGKMGLSHLAIATQIIGKSNIVLCDTSWAQRRLIRSLGYRVAPSLEAVLAAGTPVAGVIISTPTPSHFALTRAVLARGIPCFVEKPLTLDPEASARLTGQQGDPARHQVGLVLRYVASFLRLRALVQGGRLGPVQRYSALMAGNVITAPGGDSWRTDFSHGGGCLNEYGPHLFDLCRFIFGEVATLGAAQAGYVHSTRADDRMHLDWTHASGVPGALQLDWCDLTQRKSLIRFDVHLQHGRIEADNAQLTVSLHDDAPLTEEERAEMQAPVLPLPVSLYLRGEEYSLQLEAFLGAIAGQNAHVGAVPEGVAARLEDGLAVDRLIDMAARRSGLK